MPTALVLPLRKADALLQPSQRRSTAINRNLGVVGAFTAIGFALTALFPFTGNALALTLIMT